MICHHLPKNNSNIHFCGWSMGFIFIDISVCKHYGEEPCVREITTNYVTLTTSFWHFCSIWNITFTCILNNLLIICESLLVYGLWPNPTSSSIAYKHFPSLSNHIHCHISLYDKIYNIFSIYEICNSFSHFSLFDLWIKFDYTLGCSKKLKLLLK